MIGGESVVSMDTFQEKFIDDTGNKLLNLKDEMSETIPGDFGSFGSFCSFGGLRADAPAFQTPSRSNIRILESMVTPDSRTTLV